MSEASLRSSRRAFIRGATAFGAFNIIPAGVLWGATAPSNQLTRALMGWRRPQGLGRGARGQGRVLV